MHLVPDVDPGLGHVLKSLTGRSGVAVQDAYMPKDASKQSHRGIGFVTFSSSDSVEAVMSTPHSLNGQELAIDRATPKDKASAL